MAARQVFMDQLMAMGISSDRANMALDSTGGASVDAALEWHYANPESSQDHPLSRQVQQAPSIRCSVCGIAIFGEAHATKHATQTKHLQFEEYIPKPGEEIVAPPPEKSSMTEEEKLAKIEELRKRNEIARQQKQVQQEKDQFDKEKKRRQDAKESEAARQKWKEDQERKLIEEQKREKAEEAKYKEDLKRKIAEDKLKKRTRA